MTRLDIGSGGQSTLSDVSVPAANRRLDISALAANKLVYTYWHQWPSEPSRRFQPPMLHRHAATKLALMLHPYRNQAVPNLPCSLVVQSGSSQPSMFSMYNHTIRQFLTYVLNVHSGSFRPPMFSMYSMQLCSQCTQSTITNVEHVHELQVSTPLLYSSVCIYDCPHQVSVTPMEQKEIFKLPMYFHQHPEYFSSAVP